jgi:hypothetical protein
MQQLGFHWPDFHEIWYLSTFRKSVEKIQVSLKYDKNNGHFTWKPMYIYDNYVHLWQYLAQFFLEWEMFQTKVVENKHTFYVQ